MVKTVNENSDHAHSAQREIRNFGTLSLPWAPAKCLNIILGIKEKDALPCLAERILKCSKV